MQDKGKDKSKDATSENVAQTPTKKEIQPSPVKKERTAAQVVAESKAGSVPTSPLKVSQTSPAVNAEMKSSMSSTKRQHPGPLQIPKKEPIAADSLISSATEAAAKNPRTMSITAESTSRPGTPTGATTGSPLKRTGPQIMRITNTPKAETPPALTASSAPATGAIPPSVASIRSRQPSVASINQPGTPISDFISDNASMTSASMSRANSPPPGSRIGSAPQRTKTKSQAKKERQERARQMAEVELGLKESRTPSEEPVVAEGIQTRKKKEKKPKPAKAPKTAASTPAESRTGTPGPAEKAPSPEVHPEAVVEKEKPAEAVEAAPVEAPKQPPPVTPAAVIAKLLAEGAITHETLENMYKSFPQGPNERQITLQDVPNRDRQYTLSDEMIKAVLERREAQRLGGEDGRISSRVLVTPEGTILRGLSREEEDRYLELEASLRKSAGTPTKWNPTRDPFFDLDRIVRNLNVRAVVEKSNTIRQTQAALQKAAAQAAAAAAAANGGVAAARVFDEAANYNDEFIMPSSPVALPEDIVPAAVENADRVGGAGATNLSASTSSTATTASTATTTAGLPVAGAGAQASSLLSAPFESHYISVNGITLSDAAAPVLGIELGKGGGFPGHGASAAAGVVKGQKNNGAGAGAGGPVLSLQEIERELNVEKQRANEFTKKLNAAIKRNRKVVGAAGH
ncbi:hypothetical protein B0J12DRAFT_705517 [Macrophomina phaseolina]|uniref:Uncharacterized protein n=1 Tax=Macrophomina phaseolina TaxID=35725 RepID=A0ABQ8FRR3_9PEZI|nr:hypothetical protein B0J12DRAFT_705517 [Macrophomina phaseolina]